MIDPDNAVERLFEVSKRLGQNKDASVLDALGTALSADPKKIEFHRRIAIFLDTIEQAQRQVEGLGDDPNYSEYVKAVETIRSTLDQIDLRGPWANYIAAFNLRNLTLLEICSRTLNPDFARLCSSLLGMANREPGASG